MVRRERLICQRSSDDIFPRPRRPRDGDPSLVGTALAAIGWTMLTVVILTAILVACCAPFALAFMFIRRVVGA